MRRIERRHHDRRHRIQGEYTGGGAQRRGSRVGIVLVLVAFVAVTTVGAYRGGRPTAVEADTPTYASDRFIPLAMSGFAAPFPTLPTALPATATRPLPTAPPSTTPVPTGTTTPGPSPTPTLPGGPVEHPTSPDTIILQLGWSDTDQQGAAWEEMNGTPFFTVYGDGRAIGGPALFDWRQPLFEGFANEDEIQGWLRPLTYQAQFYTLKHRYDAPGLRTFAVHLYVRYGDGRDDYHRVSLGGFTRWLGADTEPGSEAERVRLLAQLVKDMERFSRERLATPFVPEEHTVLAHEVNRILPVAPAWRHSLDIAAISDRAPLDPEGGNVHGPPGHQRLAGDAGRAVREVVAPDARRDFPGYNEAAEYSFRGRRFVVGARQEVPGGSPFLPDSLRRVFYRVDG